MTLLFVLLAITDSVGASGTQSGNSGNSGNSGQSGGSHPEASPQPSASPDPETGTHCPYDLTCGEDICDIFGKPKKLTFEYVGGGASDSNDAQGSKSTVSGDDTSIDPAHIITSDRADPFQRGAKRFFEGPVPLNSQFMVLATESKLPSDIWIFILDPHNDRTLQTLKIHTSCSRQLAHGDQFGAIVLRSFVDENGCSAGECAPHGTPSPTPTASPDPSPSPSSEPSTPPEECEDVVCGTDICDVLGKPSKITMLYLGGGASDNDHEQGSKVDITGSPTSQTPVRIIASSKANAFDSSAKIFFDGTVDLNGLFMIDSANDGQSKLPSDTYVHILRPGSNELLQRIKFHTSCSKPLEHGNRFGAIQLVSLIDEDGCDAGDCDVVPPSPTPTPTPTPTPPPPPHAAACPQGSMTLFQEETTQSQSGSGSSVEVYGPIDISTKRDIRVLAKLCSEGNLDGTGDYANIEYRIDGGQWQLIPNQNREYTDDCTTDTDPNKFDGSKTLSGVSYCSVDWCNYVVEKEFQSYGGASLEIRVKLAINGYESMNLQLLSVCGSGDPEPHDECPDDPLKTEPGECGCGVPDTDTDNDGVPDCNDNCPEDPHKTEPGICGCGVSDRDSDYDGVPDCEDGCPRNSLKIQDDDCGCDRPYRDGYNATAAAGSSCARYGAGHAFWMPRISTSLVFKHVPDVPQNPMLLEWANNNTATLRGRISNGANIHFDVDLAFFTPSNTPTGGQLFKELKAECYVENGGTVDASTWRYYATGNGTITGVAGSSYAGAVLRVQTFGHDPQLGVGANGKNINLGFAAWFNWYVVEQPTDHRYHLANQTDQNDINIDLTSKCDGDNCPNDPNKEHPGICGCGVPDTDTDHDGTPDCIDGCPEDPLKTEPGECGCGVPDTDSDYDGTPDCRDGCPEDPEKIRPGQCGCGVLDTDTDHDGTADCNDGCPHDPLKTEPGHCGCGVVDRDYDQDGVYDCNDGCPHNPNKTAPGVCGCALPDTDTDNDGVPDCNDGCPEDPRKIHPGVCGCGVPDTDTDNDGTPDCRDGCPHDPLKTEPGVCGCGVLDTDTDNDGTPDCNDGCPRDPLKTNPGQCGCGQSEQDSDYDGTPDCNDNCPHDPNKVNPGACGCGEPETPNCGDNCPNDPNKTEPGVCGCGVPDIDSDYDGTLDCEDLCPNDPDKVEPGVCGCGVSDEDTDNDGTPDCNDGCPEDPLKTEPLVCGCGNPETDTDYDGTPDCIDQCPEDPLKTEPGDCGCGVPDTDTDNDGTPDCDDLCPEDPLKTTPGECGCGVSDADTDNDGTPDCNDGCPDDPNKTEPLRCGCGESETDSDYDGTPDCNDGCPEDPNKTEPGECGCGVADTDSDQDGTPNCDDGCPHDPRKTSPGICGCGVADTDSDYDGVPDCNDGCPQDPDKTQPGVCGCGVPDTDSDYDGTPDCEDGCPADPNKVAPLVCGCGNPETDSDYDGTPDCNDLCPHDPLKVTPGECGCGELEVPNCGDDCPNDPNKDSPGICGCGVPDTDTDLDGVPDCIDVCPGDPYKTVSAGQCGCGVPETDSDYDGTPDCLDGCPQDPLKTHPGVCGCGVPEIDSDNDGTPDCNDRCPHDPLKIRPGLCGCNATDVDSDYDGVPDCLDGCPEDPLKTEPLECGCGVSDADGDNDGTPNCVDGCPEDPLKTQPGVCGCGVPDQDTDQDGVYDCNDGCPHDPDKIHPGECGCGVPDTDSNNDQIPDCIDQCPDDPLKTEPGICGCGVPDVDSDNDGVHDCNDGCPNDPLKTVPGACNCGVPDTDSDNDGTPDCNDGCPQDPLKTSPGACGCGESETDTDSDGTPDCTDGCPENAYKVLPGPCGCEEHFQEGYNSTAAFADSCAQFSAGHAFYIPRIANKLVWKHVPKVTQNPMFLQWAHNQSATLQGIVTDVITTSTITFFADLTFYGFSDTPTLGNPLKELKSECYTENGGTVDTTTWGFYQSMNGTLTATAGSLHDGAVLFIETHLHAPQFGIGANGKNKNFGLSAWFKWSVLSQPHNILYPLVDLVDQNDINIDLLPKCGDLCPYDPHKTAPGVCGCGVRDTDSDQDGVPDCNDGCPHDPEKTDPGQCGCYNPDTDTDNDGTADCVDGCPEDPNKTNPGACGCGEPETPNCGDNCPNDPNKEEPGICGCGVPDTDSDNDGTPDCNDGCPHDRHKTEPGRCNCGHPETDLDNDGTPDCIDGCPEDPNKITPGQCGCGNPETDTDYDGAADCVDGCPQDPLKTEPGQCGCGVPETPNCGDGCPNDPLKTEPGECGCGVPDTDSDYDGVPDCNDGCAHDPFKTEPGQCGCGVLDVDHDNDTVADCIDGCPYDPLKTEPGRCGCGVSDVDTDNDGTPDCEDLCPEDPEKTVPGECGCGVPDTDSDYDGVPDCIDGCPQDPNKISPGACGCGEVDTDTDNDGVPDCIDQCPEDPNKVTPGACGCGESEQDSDYDGTPDCIDECPHNPRKIIAGNCGCDADENDLCCDCRGIHSLTIVYQDPGGHPEVIVKLSDGEGSPQEVQHVKSGDFITFFGTYGSHDILGPSTITIDLFDQATPYVKFEWIEVDVTCDEHPLTGDYIGNYFHTHSLVFAEYGDECIPPCNYTVAVVLDASAAVTPQEAEQIREAVKDNLLRKFAGENKAFVALYAYSYEATLIHDYVDANVLANWLSLEQALMAFEFDQERQPPLITPVKSNWDAAFRLVKETNDMNDIVLFFAHHGPTVHFGPGGEYVPLEYGDDLQAAVNSANALKQNGKNRIVAIATSPTNEVDSTLTVAQLQAISGPFAQHDYFLAGSTQFLPFALELSCTHLCCAAHKDVCGICHGDGRACLDCAGIPNGHTEYDFCGVCGGDGSTCPPPRCDEHSQTQVEEWTGLRILVHNDIKKFEFKYHSNLPNENTTLVVGFSPYDNEGCQLHERGTCDSLPAVAANSIQSNRDYCDLFSFQRLLLGNDPWKTHYDAVEDHVVTCANFTTYDLQACRDAQGERGLIRTLVPNKHFSGTVYGSVVEKPENCNYDPFYPHACSEKVVISTHYKFELWIDSGGEVGAQIMSTKTEVEAKWLCNRWLATGDVIIQFKTRIGIEDGSDHPVQLTNPYVLVQNQTGIPFHVLSGTNCTGENEDHEEICEQLWEIRTFGATGVMDFSGVKPVRFDVSVHNVTKSQHIVWLNVTIIRGPDPVEARLSLDAWMALFKDSYFQRMLSPTDSIINCHHVFAKVALHHNASTPLQIDRVDLCISDDPETKDLEPFDPSDPQNTGCNTPGVSITTFTLFRRLPHFVNSLFEFEFVDGPHSSVSEAYFKFKARALGLGKQQIQVLWSTPLSPFSHQHHNNNLYGNLISASIVEPAAGHRFRGHSHHLVDLHSLQYPKQFYHESLLARFNDDDDDDNYSNVVVHDQDDDDGQGHPGGGTHVYHFSQQTLSVHCEEDEYWHDGECYKNHYGSFTFINFLLAFLFLIFVFVVCLGVFWCLSHRDKYGAGLPHSSTSHHHHHRLHHQHCEPAGREQHHTAQHHHHQRRPAVPVGYTHLDLQ